MVVRHLVLKEINRVLLSWLAGLKTRLNMMLFQQREYLEFGKESKKVNEINKPYI